jgi:hypothetical protein
MGIQELLFSGVAVIVLLAALIYGSVVAGRRRENAATDAATRRNFHMQNGGPRQP